MAEEPPVKKSKAYRDPWEERMLEKEIREKEKMEMEKREEKDQESEKEFGQEYHHRKQYHSWQAYKESEKAKDQNHENEKEKKKENEESWKQEKDKERENEKKQHKDQEKKEAEALSVCLPVSIPSRSVCLSARPGETRMPPIFAEGFAPDEDGVVGFRLGTSKLVFLTPSPPSVGSLLIAQKLITEEIQHTLQEQGGGGM
jgi:hypothetical protein